MARRDPRTRADALDVTAGGRPGDSNLARFAADLPPGRRLTARDAAQRDLIASRVQYTPVAAHQATHRVSDDGPGMRQGLVRREVNGRNLGKSNQ